MMHTLDVTVCSVVIVQLTSIELIKSHASHCSCQTDSSYKTTTGAHTHSARGKIIINKRKRNDSVHSPICLYQLRLFIDMTGTMCSRYVSCTDRVWHISIYTECVLVGWHIQCQRERVEEAGQLELERFSMVAALHWMYMKCDGTIRMAEDMNIRFTICLLKEKLV